MISSIFFGTSTIFYAFQDWENHPTIISIGSMDSPLSEISFPAVTFCHEPHFKPDNWALPELILNFMKFSCKENENIQQCLKNIDDLRYDFRPIVKDIWTQVNDTLDIIDKSFFSEDLTDDMIMRLIEARFDSSRYENSTFSKSKSNLSKMYN